MKVSIISYLAPDSTEKVITLQQKLGEITGSIAALQIWQPHLTIGDGIKISQQQLAVFETKLMQIATRHHRFNITLRGFDSLTSWKPGAGQTGTPYVIYIHVEPSQALLRFVRDIADAIGDENRWYRMPCTTNHTLPSSTVI